MVKLYVEELSDHVNGQDGEDGKYVSAKALRKEFMVSELSKVLALVCYYSQQQNKLFEIS